MKQHNIFISWSGDRSKLIADAFREWLPMVIQAAKPWMSSANIDKGSRGLLEMAKALDGIKVGISCLTPENLTAPWILYEAGSLAKSVDDKTRLCTYLLGGLENKDIEPPLGHFQHTKPEKEDTRQLVHTINKAVGGDEPLSEKTVDTVFDQFWPLLEKKLNAFPAAPKAVAKRSLDDMVAEILEFTRAETNSRTKSFRLTAGGLPLLANTADGMQIYGSSNGLPEFYFNPPQGEVQISNNIVHDRVFGRPIPAPSKGLFRNGTIPEPPKDDDGNETD